MEGNEAEMQPQAQQEEYEESSDLGHRYWWVNQGGSGQAGVEGGTLWAPLASKNGVELAHHKRMTELKVGDTVIHYCLGRILAVSSITKEAVDAPVPSEMPSDYWLDRGRLARVDVHMLVSPVPLSDIPLEWRLEEKGPFTRNGSVNQGYLYPVSSDLVARLCGRFPELAEIVTIDVEVPGETPTNYIEPDFETIRLRIAGEGIQIEEQTLRRFHLSLWSRGFVVLSGVSGTGKTWLAQAYARAVEGRELLCSGAQLDD